MMLRRKNHDDDDADDEGWQTLILELPWQEGKPLI